MKKIKKNLEQILGRSIDYYKNELKKRYNDFDFKKNKKVVLFGAADMCRIYIDLCRQNALEVIAICDNDESKNGKRLANIPIISPSSLQKNYPRDTSIIITTIYEEEVRDQLANLGFNNIWSFKYFAIFHPHRFKNPHWLNSIDLILNNKKNILECIDLLGDRLSLETYFNVLKYRLLFDKNLLKRIVRPKTEEYFDKRVMQMTDKEVFVDGGAYVGDTILHFLSLANGSFSKIFSFEPDTKSYNQLNNLVKKLNDKRIEVFKLGLGKKEESVNFASEGTLGSRITQDGSVIINLVSIDSFFSRESEIPTLIKLDIEGAEKDALIGARTVISKYGPKLAICIYHKPSHLWEIPLFIKKTNPQYSFYMRHYTENIYDTVLYGIKTSHYAKIKY